MSGKFDVAVKATIESKGLTAEVRSRAISSVDRMLGAVFTIPAEWFEGHAALVRERMARRVLEIRNSETSGRADELCFEQLEDQEKLDKLTKARNKKKIIDKAIEGLSTSQDKGDDEDREIEPEWLDLYSSVVGNISDEHMQEFWANLLKRKIENSKSVSRSTLQLLRNIDSETARLFEDFRAGIFPKLGLVISERVSGYELINLQKLSDAGLLSSPGAPFTYAINPNDKGVGVISTGRHALVMTQPETPRRGVNISLLSLTRAASEIHALLPSIDEVELLEHVWNQCKHYFPEGIVKQLIKIPDQPTAISYRDVKILHSRKDGKQS